MTYYLKADVRPLTSTSPLKSTVIYASKSNSTSTQWVVDYFFDDANEQWYKYKGSDKYYTAGKNKEDILNSISSDTTLWETTNDIP